jgi:hypothetical protein
MSLFKMKFISSLLCIIDMSDSECCIVGILFTSNAYPHFNCFCFVSSNEVLVIHEKIVRLVVSHLSLHRRKFCVVVCCDNFSICCYVNLHILRPIDWGFLQFPPALIIHTIINFRPIFGYWMLVSTRMPILDKKQKVRRQKSTE